MTPAQVEGVSFYPHGITCAYAGLKLHLDHWYQQTAEAVATQLPDAQEQALDEYPMPDPALTQDDLEKCGYLDGDLLPLSKERAYELMERDLTVYIVQEGENPEMAFDTADLDAHDGIFAVSREEWEESPEFDMNNFTFEETNLLCIYNTGSRTGLIDALTEMRGELSPEEAELRKLTDSALGKLQAMSDAEFAELELFPDFDE